MRVQAHAARVATSGINHQTTFDLLDRPHRGHDVRSLPSATGRGGGVYRILIRGRSASGRLPTMDGVRTQRVILRAPRLDGGRQVPARERKARP